MGSYIPLWFYSFLMSHFDSQCFATNHASVNLALQVGITTFNGKKNLVINMKWFIYTTVVLLFPD